MAEGKPVSGARHIAAVVIVMAAGCDTLYPGDDDSGGSDSSGWSQSSDAVRDDDYVHCELHAKKVYDAGEVLDVEPSRYDYTFTCAARADVILSELVITAGEVVTSRNTGVGKDEKSDRRLDSDRQDGKITIKAGTRFVKRGRLTRKSSISGSRGYIELNARLRFLDGDGKAGANPTALKTFLKLRVPAA